MDITTKPLEKPRALALLLLLRKGPPHFMPLQARKSKKIALTELLSHLYPLRFLHYNQLFQLPPPTQPISRPIQVLYTLPIHTSTFLSLPSSDEI